MFECECEEGETRVGVVLVPDLICTHGRRMSGSRERSSKRVLSMICNRQAAERSKPKGY